MKSFSISRRRITASPLRSLLTVSAVALGVGMLLAASILMTAASQSAAQLAAQEQGPDLQIFRRQEAHRKALFDIALMDAVSKTHGVAQVLPSLSLSAKLSSADGRQLRSMDELQALGVVPEYAEMHHLDVVNGAFLGAPDSLVLPMEIALRNGLSTGETLTLEVGGRSSRFRVVGRLALPEGAALAAADATTYLPLETAQFLGNVPGQINRLDVRLAQGAQTGQVQASLLDLLGMGFAVARTRSETTFSVIDVLVEGLLAMVG